MKKIFFVAVIIIALIASVFAQAKSVSGNGKDNALKETLINLEKRTWQARKDKDDKHLSILTTVDLVNVGEIGVIKKAEILKDVTRPKCQFKNYKMEEVSATIFNANTALLTYKAEFNYGCEDKDNLRQVWVSSLYLKQNGKWLNAFRQETTVNPQK